MALAIFVILLAWVTIVCLIKESRERRKFAASSHNKEEKLTMQPTALTPEFRAQLHLSQPKCTVTINASSAEDVQNFITHSLKGKTSFDTDQETVLVYNENQNNGGQPCGWITTYSVPQQMSVKALADHRQGVGQTKAA